MLLSARPGQWVRSEESATYQVDIEDGVKRVQIWSPDWPRAWSLPTIHGPDPNTEDQFQVRRIGLGMVAVCQVNTALHGSLKVTARDPPNRLNILLSSHPTAELVSRQVLPKTFLSSQSLSQTRPDDLIGYQRFPAASTVVEDLDRFASSWIDTPDDERVGWARDILNDLATRPFRRAEHLGAFIAALLKQSDI